MNKVIFEMEFTSQFGFENKLGGMIARGEGVIAIEQFVNDELHRRARFFVENFADELQQSLGKNGEKVPALLKEYLELAEKVEVSMEPNGIYLELMAQVYVGTKDALKNMIQTEREKALRGLLEKIKNLDYSMMAGIEPALEKLVEETEKELSLAKALEGEK